MRRACSCYWTLASLLLLSTATAADPSNDPAKKADALTWLPSLADARTQAQRRRQPVLVRVASESCVWCQKLEKELEQAKARTELARWTLVLLDVDRLGADNRTLLVGAVPALRLLTPTGRVVASRDGYLTADALAAWLKENYDKAAVLPAEELTGDGVPTPAEVGRLVKELNNRDAALREAAVRRLLPHPALAAPAVADAFAAGPLQPRLAALELLREWKAPLKELDPWQPDTLTATRLDALRKWAAERKPADDSRGALTPEQRGDARRDLTRLVQAPDAEADAIQERLARHGPALLPEVHALLPGAATDLARERLTALRYRLAASTELVLSWPGGLARLASSDAARRQQAAQELVSRATADEEALLLEMFTNPDALVREISLRGLRKFAGQRATVSLTRLLADPEPNVRAAVLKQLAERPAPALVPLVRDYLATEKDPALIVHAARVLRASPGRTAATCLIKLLGHESWRVRAEAAEALGESVGSNSPLPDAMKIEAFAALVERLQDTDGFVVSRAVKAMRGANLAVLIEPMVQASDTYPELGPEVIASLTFHSQIADKVLPYLHKLCVHKHAATRASALKALGWSATVDELRAGLKDSSSAVRTVAATVLFNQLTDTGKFADDLLPLLRAEAAEERLAAALALTGAKRTTDAVPVLLAVARAEPTLRERAAEALPRLAWEQRAEVFRQLLALDPGPAELEALIEGMSHEREKKAIPLLWQLTLREDRIAEVGVALVQSLRQLHFGDAYRQRYDGRVQQIDEEDRKEAIAAARPRAMAGPALQRFVALAVLHTADAAEASTLAATVFADEKAPPMLRADAFRMRLLTQPRREASRTAIAALSSPVPAIARLALAYLGGDMDYQYETVGGSIDFGAGERPVIPSDGTRRAWEPDAPEGLTAEALRPLLSRPELELTARAGYLLALLGDPTGLPPLLRYWHEKAHDDEHWAELVGRAIAALGVDENVPVLEEIYALHAAELYHDVREFYWTIRRMEGPSALKLRKRIRAEVGMDALR